MKTWQKIIAALLAVILVPLAAYHFIPDRELQGVAERYFASQGYTLTAVKFGKTFLPGISAKGVAISDNRGPLVKLDRLTCRIGMLSLLQGKPSLNIDGSLGSGTVTATLKSGKVPSGSLTAKGIRLEDVPFFRTATGAVIKGLFRADASFSGTAANVSGELRAEVKGAQVADLKIGALALPAAGYDRVQAMFRAKSGKGRIESVTLQGEGIYTRLSGDLSFASPVGSTPLNLILEIMPQPEFMEKQKFVFLLMAKYLDSPGHYRIPVGGVLGKPSVY